jgi:hypothetical protein
VAAVLGGERRLAVPAGLERSGQRPGDGARRTLFQAAAVLDVAVNLINARGRLPGPQVQAVDVLGDQQEASAQQALGLQEGPMGDVGLRCPADRAAVEVPAPDLVRHLVEGAAGGQLHRLVVREPTRR